MVEAESLADGYDFDMFFTKSFTHFVFCSLTGVNNVVVLVMLAEEV